MICLSRTNVDKPILQHEYHCTPPPGAVSAETNTHDETNTHNRMLPSEWLDLNDTAASSSYPLLHSEEFSTWLPGLRTLSLGSNNITMTVYQALQSCMGLQSLQSLDLSNNVLTGTLEGAFDWYYCQEDDSGNSGSSAYVTEALRSSTSVVLAILFLGSNFMSGALEEESALPSSLSVLTVSDNLLYGPVPDDFSQLAVFFVGE